AKQSACGFLLFAACSISVGLSTWDSFSGPSNVMFTLYWTAAFSAPCFTACQNWCWKPFEIIGMNGLAAGAPPPPPAGACPPHAAATRTSEPANAMNACMALVLMVSSTHVVGTCPVVSTSPYSMQSEPPPRDREDGARVDGIPSSLTDIR